MVYVTRALGAPQLVQVGADTYTGIVGCSRLVPEADVDHLLFSGWARLNDGDPIALVSASNVTGVGDWNYWPGGEGYYIAASSNFNGSTARLQFLGPNGAALEYGTTTNLAASGGALFVLPPGQIRVQVDGGGNPTAMSVTVAKVWR